MTLLWLLPGPLQEPSAHQRHISTFPEEEGGPKAGGTQTKGSDFYLYTAGNIEKDTPVSHHTLLILSLSGSLLLPRVVMYGLASQMQILF